MTIDDFRPVSNWIRNTGNPYLTFEEFIEYECTSGAKGFDQANNLSFKVMGLGSDIARYRVLEKNPTKKQSPLEVQVDGSHYKDLKIQPIEYIHANNIPFPEGSVIKYVTRWRSKNGLKDLQKAKHFIELLIELESKK